MDLKATEINKITANPAPQYLDNRRGVRTMKEYRLKVEIAQQELSDLGRRSLAP